MGHLQVKTTVPDQINVLLQGIPTTVEVKGLQLNTSLVQDPEVTPDRLIVRDWGRFKNPVQVSEVSLCQIHVNGEGLLMQMSLQHGFGKESSRDVPG